MSMFRAIQTVFNDAACLVETLKEQGYKEVERHDSPQPLLGSPIRGGDNKAEIIVRKSKNPTLYGDLGFVKQPDGTYSMAARMFVEKKPGKGYIQAKEWTKEFNVAYGVNKVKRIAKKNGWNMLTTKTTDGKVKMQFKVTA